MRSRPPLLVDAALALLLTPFLLAACSGLPGLAQSASELAKSGSVAWASAPAYRVQGTLRIAEGTLRVDVVQAVKGGFRGTGQGALEGRPFDYLASDGESFLKGQSFWQQYYRSHSTAQTQARGFENHWARATLTDVADDLAQLPQLGGAVARLDDHPDQFRRGGSRTVDGQSATAVTGDGMTFWIVPGEPDRIVGFQARSVGTLREVDVGVAEARARKVSMPPASETVDPGNPLTLPAFYSVVNSQTPLYACGVSSCQVMLTIQDDNGPPQGTSVVEATLLDQQSAAVSSCSATIPSSIGPGQQGTVTCVVSGAAWSAYASGEEEASGGYVYAAVDTKITKNPPYVG